jgi:hypothetical protein
LIFLDAHRRGQAFLSSGVKSSCFLWSPEAFSQDVLFVKKHYLGDFILKADELICLSHDACKSCAAHVGPHFDGKHDSLRRRLFAQGEMGKRVHSRGHGEKKRPHFLMRLMFLKRLEPLLHLIKSVNKDRGFFTRNLIPKKVNKHFGGKFGDVAKGLDT